MSIDLDQSVAQIHALGFTLIKGLLSKGHLAELSAAIDALQEEDNATWGRDYLYKIGQEGFVINVADRSPAFVRLLEQMPVVPLVDAALGDSAFLYLFQGVVVPPGGGVGAYPWKWHCDMYHVLLDVGDRDFLPGLNVLFFVDDVDGINGGTWIIPGSQGLTSEQMPCQDQHFLDSNAIQVKAPAGSALVFNPLMWHCAGANHTDKPRRAIKMLMIRDWMVPQMDYSRSIRPEILNGLSERSKRILGHDSQIPRSFQELSNT